MGFHKRRRHRGGGHGGGGHGGGGHGGGHGERAVWTGEANGIQPGDDVGNRKSFKPVLVPPDDIGNRRDPDEEDFIPVDDIGNRVDANPTHELSGVLLDLDPKKRRRRPKGAAPLERVGRYIVGGVNPLVAGGNRPMPPGGPAPATFDDVAADDEAAFGGEHEQRPPPQQKPKQQQQQSQKKKFEQVDGAAAQEVSERRAQRFFDFDEDDRFDYTLKSPPEDKRALAERFVTDILREAGRDATIAARVLHDGDKPKLVVTIDDRGPLSSLPPERRGPSSASPLFVLGNGALLSLNYLVNKVVNRYPDDRIRLAVLPLADEKLYLESLEHHRRRGGAETVPAVAAVEAVEAVVAPSPAPVVVAIAAAPAHEPLAEAVVAAPAPMVPAAIAQEAPAKKPRRGRKKADDVDDVAIAAPAPMSVPASAPEPVAAPPPVAMAVPTPTPAPVPVSAPAAIAAPEPPAAASAAPVSEPVIDEAPRARRRAPPLDDFPVRPPRGEGAPLPRGKVRRASTAFVEVVRVPKKP